MSELFATFGVNWKLLLVQAVNFGLLLSILTYFLYKPILRIIDERRERIAEGVRTAEAATRKLEESKSKGKEIVGEATREAEGIVATARTHADERADEIVRSAESQAQGVLRDAKERAEEAKRQVLKESEREIARVAMLAAEKILIEKHS